MAKPVYKANDYNIKANTLKYLIGKKLDEQKIMNKLNSGKEVKITVTLRKIGHAQEHEESEGERQAYDMFGI